MKYSVIGFNQEELVELIGQGIKLDVSDLVILKWIADLMARSSTHKKDIDGHIYVWVKYDTLLSDLPILGIKKRALKVRLDNLVESGLLYHYHDKEKGSLSFYALTEKYDSLVYNEGGYAKNCIGGMQNFAEHKLIKEKTKISILEREKIFVEKVNSFSDKYPMGMLEKFINYWTQKLSDNSYKMLFESQKAFEISKRLATWASKDYNKEYTKSSHIPQEREKKTPWEEMGMTQEEYKEFMGK